MHRSFPKHRLNICSGKGAIAAGMVDRVGAVHLPSSAPSAAFVESLDMIWEEISKIIACTVHSRSTGSISARGRAQSPRGWLIVLVQSICHLQRLRQPLLKAWT